MSKVQITITGKVEDYFEALVNEGIISWNTPQAGITVSSDVRAALELLHAVAAGATVTVNRDQNNRVTSISVSSYSTQTYDALNGDMEDAIDSYGDDGIEENDGYTP